jgi:PIN domain nuclease of toxin-antitoxin system
LKLLLDTHIWIWSVAEKGKLRPRVLRAIGNPQNELWLSPISVWELSILVDKRRLVLDRDIKEWVSQAFQSAGLREAPLTMEVALATRDVRLTHRDPADTFLAATAKVFDLTLVTSDARLIAAQGISILANR